MAATAPPTLRSEPAGWDSAAKAMFRAAQAVAGCAGPTLFADLVRELADTLRAACVFVAVFSDETHRQMRTLAAVLDERPLQNFDYVLEGTPCAQVVGRAFRHVCSGVAAEFQPGTIFAVKGMDSYAAFPLFDSAGNALGLLVAMDRRPIADATLAEALLKIFAGRMVAEIERNRVDEALRAAALAVSSTRGDSVFVELVRLLAAILRVEVAFISRYDSGEPQALRVLAMQCDQQMLQDVRTPIQGTPCETVLGQRFRVYADRLLEHFPEDTDAMAQGVVSYAGCPLTGQDGAALGTVAIASRAPLLHVQRIESVLQIFAVRAAAEIERMRATEALRRSEASYRSIFEAAEDTILIHDWDSGTIVDANPKACATYGYTRDELIRLSATDLGANEPPYTVERALHYLQLARLGRCPPFEWHSRHKSGALHWDEVRLKPVQIDGRRHILAFTRDITEHKTALAALQASEQQYRALFDSSADAMGLWDGELRVVDVNRAFTRISGWTRDEVVGQRLADRDGEPEVEQRIALIRAALAGREGRIETVVPSKDGRRFEVEVRYIPVRFGGVDYALSVARDITERNAALAALRAREEQYRVIFDGSADSLAVWNSEMQKIDTNPAYTRLFGYSRDEASGMSFPDNLDAPAQAMRVELIRAALAGQEGSIETYGVRRDGRRFDLELRYLPIRYAGEPHVLAVGRDITERKRTEQALRDSEEQYRAIFNASADALLLRDAEHRAVEVNPAYLALSGYGRDEVLGADGPLTQPDALLQREYRQQHERALAGEMLRFEVQATRKDGTRFNAEVRGVPVAYRGQPHVLYAARDITERRAAEARLRDSEQQYREIFNASVDALVLWNSRYQRVDINRAYERIFGWTRDEVVGRGYDVPKYPDAYIAPRRELVRRALAGEACSAELEALRKSGERLRIEVHAIPFQHQGEAHVLAIVRDITEKRAAADALAMREQQYRAIFEGSTDSLVLWDDRIRFVDVNPTYTRMYGFTRDEVVGTGIDERLPPEAAEQRRSCIRAALAGQERVLETTALRKNGESFEVELRYLPIMHLGVPHVLAIARDITERRAAEAQREQLEAQLRQAQKMEAIGQLTGGIAHDFNNILTSVIGYLVLGQERAGALGDERLQRQLDKAALAAQRARELIAQMLAFARRQRGERRVLPLAPLVQQTLQLLRSTLPTSVAVNSVLPGDDVGLCVEADAVQLEQVLFNLCLNSRDAIGEAGLIKVRLREAGCAFTCASCRAQLPAARWVELSVADNGSGIEPGTLERMFEPFFSTKEVGRGSGMGLAMVHGIVHDHGGHVIVETAVQAGSVFRVLLPPARGAAPAEPEAALPAPAGQPLTGRVMVVDDEAMVGDFMAELLDGWGLEVVLQRDPRQALAWLEQPQQPLDLLITDQTMPHLSGLQLAQRAARARPGLPVLLYTGNAEAVDSAEAQRHGVCGVLRKPVDAEALHALMQQCLGKARGAAVR
ncbi:MAG TPA: PAS domain S-box protein [Rubrivivax sp.]|nr:PAS domain S-box protein [Rubrivivax sp.]